MLSEEIEEQPECLGLFHCNLNRRDICHDLRQCLILINMLIIFMCSFFMIIMEMIIVGKPFSLQYKYITVAAASVVIEVGVIGPLFFLYILGSCQCKHLVSLGFLQLVHILFQLVMLAVAHNPEYQPGYTQ